MRRNWRTILACVVLASCIVIPIASIWMERKSERWVDDTQADLSDTYVYEQMEYIYKDNHGVVHSDLDCPYIWSDTTYAMHRIEQYAIKMEDLYYCCYSCVDDDLYEYLLSVARGNEK